MYYGHLHRLVMTRARQRRVRISFGDSYSLLVMFYCTVKAHQSPLTHSQKHASNAERDSHDVGSSRAIPLCAVQDHIYY